jgi:hypothetical protein
MQEYNTFRKQAGVPHTGTTGRNTTHWDNRQKYHTLGQQAEISHIGTTGRSTTHWDNRQKYHTLGQQAGVPHTGTTGRNTTHWDNRQKYHTLGQQAEISHTHTTDRNIAHLLYTTERGITHTHNSIFTSLQQLRTLDLSHNRQEYHILKQQMVTHPFHNQHSHKRLVHTSYTYKMTHTSHILGQYVCTEFRWTTQQRD